MRAYWSDSLEVRNTEKHSYIRVHMVALPICGVKAGIQTTNSCHKAASVSPQLNPLSRGTGESTVHQDRSCNTRLTFLADCVQ